MFAQTQGWVAGEVESLLRDGLVGVRTRLRKDALCVRHHHTFGEVTIDTRYVEEDACVQVQQTGVNCDYSSTLSVRSMWMNRGNAQQPGCVWNEQCALENACGAQL